MSSANSGSCLKPREVIDLINVAFQSETNKVKNHAETNVDYDVPDRLSGLEAVNELRAVCPGREFRFEKVDVTQEVRDESLQASVRYTDGRTGVSGTQSESHRSDVSGLH